MYKIVPVFWLSLVKYIDQSEFDWTVICGNWGIVLKQNAEFVCITIRIKSEPTFLKHHHRILRFTQR